MNEKPFKPRRHRLADWHVSQRKGRLLRVKVQFVLLAEDEPLVSLAPDMVFMFYRRQEARREGYVATRGGWKSISATSPFGVPISATRSCFSRMGRSPGVPATQSVAVVQVFLALSCEPAIRTKQIITGALKQISSSDGAQPPTDVRHCTNYKPERTAKKHERLIQRLCNSIFTRRLYSMLRIRVSHKSIFLAYPHVCFTISLLMQDFAQSISVLNISEGRKEGGKKTHLFSLQRSRMSAKCFISFGW